MQSSDVRLVSSLQSWNQKLRQWSRSGRLAAAARHAFALGDIPSPLSDLLHDWAAGDFKGRAPVQLLDNNTIQGEAGAYSVFNNQIYINAEWVRGASDKQVLAVLNEELGHQLDAVVNHSDTAGDEGRIFAAELKSDLAGFDRCASRDDHGSLVIDGRSVAVEFSRLRSRKIVSCIITSITDDAGARSGELENGQTSDDRTPLIRGTVSKKLSKKQVVLIFNGSELLGQARADSSGNWSISPSLSSDGNYTFRAAISGKGNPLSPSRSFELDTTPPAIAITTPIAGDGVINDQEDQSPVTISGTSTGANGQAMLLSVAGQSSTSLIAADGTWTITLSPTQLSSLPQGILDIVVAASDVAGNAANAGQANLVYDPLPPTLLISDDAAGITSASSFNVVFSFSEDVTGFSADAVTITSGSKGTFSGSGSQYSLQVFIPPSSSTGTITVEVPAGVAFDRAGNSNRLAVQASQLFDRQAPQAPTIASLPASTNQQIVNLTISAESGSVVNVQANGVSIGSATESASQLGTYSFATPVLLDGPTLFTATATDSAGNTSTPSQSRSITIDTTAPEAPFIDSSALSNKPTPLIHGTAEANSSIRLSIGGAIYTTTAGASDGSWGVDTSTAIPISGILALNLNGDNPLSVTARDANGNNSAPSTQVLTIDTTSPILTISDDTNGITSSVVTFSFTFSEAVSGFSADAITVTGGTKGILSGAGNLYTLSVMPDVGRTGSITVDVGSGAAQDAAGNNNIAAIQANQSYDTRFSPAELAPVIAMGSSIPADSLEARYLHSDKGIIYVAFAPDLDTTLKQWWLEVLADTDALIEPEFAVVDASNSLRQVTISQATDLPGVSGLYSYQYLTRNNGSEIRADASTYTIQLDQDAFGFNIYFGDVEEAGWKRVAYHELGHSLGLEHTFDSDDGDSNTSLTTNDSVMSYTSLIDNDGDPGFSALDQAALVSIHGAESGQLDTAQKGSTRVIDLGPYDLTHTWKSPTLTMAFVQGNQIISQVQEPGTGQQISTKLMLTRSNGTIENEARVNLNWNLNGIGYNWNYLDTAEMSRDVLIERDYTSNSISQVVFPPGEATTSLEIVINGDGVKESSEWLEVTPSPARDPDYFWSMPTQPIRLSITDNLAQALADPLSPQLPSNVDPVTGTSLSTMSISDGSTSSLGDAIVNPTMIAGALNLTSTSLLAGDKPEAFSTTSMSEPSQQGVITPLIHTIFQQSQIQPGLDLVSGYTG